MRVLLFFAVAACGNVHSDATPAPVGTTPPDAQPSPGPLPCSTHVAKPVIPARFLAGGFGPARDPVDNSRWVWVSNGITASTSTAFVVPYHDGDQITGLTIEAYGNGSAKGLQDVEVLYQPDLVSTLQTLGKVDDLGRSAQWGQIAFPGFRPAILSEAGNLWVQFTVNETGYYIGRVTPAIERPCSK